MAAPWVIDLSHHNPTPAWAEIMAAGVIGVIHKATEGTSYVDSTLFSRARAAMDAGLCWSTYHFMRNGSMTAQMEHYLGTIDPKEGERVCLDHEDEDVSLGALETAVQYLVDVRPDLQITIYSGHLIKEQLGNGYSAILAEKTSLWIAQYTSAAAPSWPIKTWPVWSLWQYTDSATVPGISAPIDGNKWNGDKDSLRVWMTPQGEEPAPSPPPPPQPGFGTAHINIQTSPGVSVSVAVNGEVILAGVG